MKFLIYFLGMLFLSSSVVLAHGAGEDDSVGDKAISWMDSDWIGPVVAVVVIMITVWISRIIKKNK